MIGEIAEQVPVGNDVVAEVVLDHHAATEAVVMVAALDAKKAGESALTVTNVRTEVRVTEMVIDSEVSTTKLYWFGLLTFKQTHRIIIKIHNVQMCISCKTACTFFSANTTTLLL